MVALAVVVDKVFSDGVMSQNTIDAAVRPVPRQEVVRIVRFSSVG